MGKKCPAFAASNRFASDLLNFRKDLESILATDFKIVITIFFDASFIFEFAKCFLILITKQVVVYYCLIPIEKPFVLFYRIREDDTSLSIFG